MLTMSRQICLTLKICKTLILVFLLIIENFEQLDSKYSKALVDIIQTKFWISILDLSSADIELQLMFLLS